MTLVERVYTVLSAAAGVTALVPASRIKPPGDWQNLTLPYIIHFPVAGRPIHTHSGIAALRLEDEYQVSCFDDDYAGAIAVAEAVRTAIGNYTADGLKLMVKREPFAMPYEADVRVQQVILTFFAAWTA